MDYDAFERRVLEVWETIPDGFKVGVTAFVVDRGTFAKEEFEEGWCFGLCEADAVLELVPDAPVCSRISIFYGSFVEIERLHRREDRPFDWDAEIVETVRHELQHHLEWRAGEDGLGDEDDLQDDNERRLTGLPFTAGFHRWGTPMGEGAWLGDDTLFVEVGVRRAEWEALSQTTLEHTWRGWTLRSEGPVPQDLLATGEAVYVPAGVHGVADDAVLPWRDVALVVWRRRGWWPFG